MNDDPLLRALHERQVETLRDLKKAERELDLANLQIAKQKQEIKRLQKSLTQARAEIGRLKPAVDFLAWLERARQ